MLRMAHQDRAIQGRVPWNLANLVGHIQPPTVGTAAEYSNSSVAAAAVAAATSSGVSSTLPHPLPQYTPSSPYGHNPHYPDVGSWGQMGQVGTPQGVAGHQNSVTPGATASASPSAGQFKIDPEPPMYYPQQVASPSASRTVDVATSSSSTTETTPAVSATNPAVAVSDTASSAIPFTPSLAGGSTETTAPVPAPDLTMPPYFAPSQDPMHSVEGDGSTWPHHSILQTEPQLQNFAHNLTDPYIPDRGGFDRKKKIIKEWTKSNASSSSTSGGTSTLHNSSNSEVARQTYDYYNSYKVDGAALRDYYGGNPHQLAPYYSHEGSFYPYGVGMGVLQPPGTNHTHSHLHSLHGNSSAATVETSAVAMALGTNINPGNPTPGSSRQSKRRRDKKAEQQSGSQGGSGATTSAMNRDERKAHIMRLPITVHDIINLPMDEFNDLLSKHELSEDQLTLCRDIRRRGKNKVAARNCRKRKIDQIKQLEDDVNRIRTQKSDLLKEHDRLSLERKHWTDMVKKLHDHVLKELGHDPAVWQLQMDQNRQVHILPRSQSSEVDQQKITRPYHYAPSLGPPLMECHVSQR